LFYSLPLSPQLSPACQPHPSPYYNHRLPANFSAAALYEFGERYFAKFEELRDPNKVFLEKAHPDEAIRSVMESL
jgi:hypothetical protein